MDPLSEIATRTKTDKFRDGAHHYTPIYHRYFAHLRDKDFRFLEIGYGGWSEKNGYNEPLLGGESARMWAEYFPNAEIIVIDNLPKRVTDTGYHFLQIDQTDREAITALGSFDIIIDDGSHRSDDVINTFNWMFPLMNDGGIYVIEDTQTSFWEELSPIRRATDHFKRLTDGLNYREIRWKGKYTPDYFDKHIFSIHFYHNLIFVFKGDNTEPSNTVRND